MVNSIYLGLSLGAESRPLCIIMKFRPTFLLKPCALICWRKVQSHPGTSGGPGGSVHGGESRLGIRIAGTEEGQRMWAKEGSIPIFACGIQVG